MAATPVRRPPRSRLYPDGQRDPHRRRPERRRRRPGACRRRGAAAPRARVRRDRPRCPGRRRLRRGRAAARRLCFADRGVEPIEVAGLEEAVSRRRRAAGRTEARTVLFSPLFPISTGRPGALRDARRPAQVDPPAQAHRIVLGNPHSRHDVARRLAIVDDDPHRDPAGRADRRPVALLAGRRAVARRARLASQLAVDRLGRGCRRSTAGRSASRARRRAR